MIRRPPRSTLSSSSAASDVYKRQGEPRAGAGKAGLDLVGDEDDPVGPTVFGELRQEARPRNDETALTLDRLDHHGSDVAAADLVVHRTDYFRCGLLTAALRAGRPAVRVSHRHPVDLGRELAERVLVRHVLGGQRHREVRPPVVAVVEGDDRLAPGVGTVSYTHLTLPTKRIV